MKAVPGPQSNRNREYIEPELTHLMNLRQLLGSENMPSARHTNSAWLGGAFVLLLIEGEPVELVALAGLVELAGLALELGDHGRLLLLVGRRLADVIALAVVGRLVVLVEVVAGGLLTTSSSISLAGVLGLEVELAGRLLGLGSTGLLEGF